MFVHNMYVHIRLLQKWGYSGRGGGQSNKRGDKDTYEKAPSLSKPARARAGRLRQPSHRRGLWPGVPARVRVRCIPVSSHARPPCARRHAVWRPSGERQVLLRPPHAAALYGRGVRRRCGTPQIDPYRLCSGLWRSILI